MAKNIGFKINLSIDGKDVVIDCRKGVQDLGRALGTIPDKAQASRNAIMGFAAATQVVQNTYSGFQQLTGIMEGFIQKSNAAAESQTKLTTVMQQRMNASAQDVKSINDMIAAQTKLGVVDGLL